MSRGALPPRLDIPRQTRAPAETRAYENARYNEPGLEAAGYREPHREPHSAPPRPSGDAVLLGGVSARRSGVKKAQRAFDVLFTLLGLSFLWPIFALIALCIRLDSPGPVLFKQKRVGRDGEEFWFFKFRSMVSDAEDRRHLLEMHNERTGPVFKMRNDPRITRTGRFLRKFSLDELPQLLNVLRGEMSLVGPRPALPKETAAYTAHQRPAPHRGARRDRALAGLGPRLPQLRALHRAGPVLHRAPVSRPVLPHPADDHPRRAARRGGLLTTFS